jgi:hypothetical protein
MKTTLQIVLACLLAAVIGYALPKLILKATYPGAGIIVESNQPFDISNYQLHDELLLEKKEFHDVDYIFITGISRSGKYYHFNGCWHERNEINKHWNETYSHIEKK